MTTLPDLIRGATLEVEDAIRLVDRKVADLEASRRAADERLRRAEVAQRESGAVLVVHRQETESLSTQLQEIEEQLRDLLSMKREKERERDEALRKVSGFEEEVARVRKTLKRDEDERDRIESDLKSLDEERHRHRRSLIEARLRAVQQHAEKVWASIRVRATSVESRQMERAAAETLARARSEDPAVASLCEAREQWQKFLSGPTVPMVRDTAKRELEAIERELEARYPGSLKGRSAAQPDPDFEDIYWFPKGESRMLLVPVPERIFQSVAEGREGPEEALAMRMVWTACRSGLIPGDRTRFRLISGLCVLEAEGDAGAGFEEVVALDLGQGLSVSALISRLPGEIEEVLI